MNKVRNVALAAAIGLIGIAGCKKLASTSQLAGALSAAVAGNKVTETSAAVPSAAAPSAMEADSALAEKLSCFIQCFNRLSISVRDAEHRYYGWVDEKTGPTGKEKSVDGVSVLSPDFSMEKLDKAKSLPPALPDIDAAAEAYRAAANKLNPLVEAANKYYQQNDYKDDKFARGKAMHAPLVAAFAEFDAADKALSDKVTVMNDALGQRRLAALAKDPKRKIQYLVEQSLADAKKLLPVAAVKKLDDVDEAKLGAAVTTFETSESNLESYASANKAEADKASMLGSTISAEKDLLKSSKDLLRRKRDKKDFNKEFFAHTDPELVDGHPAQVIKTYNALIEQTNSLTYET
ncbi:MAG TPA: DUF3829 domain-containing protein [Polyangiaceae bacterium]|jgi:hypothetical protein|nr:DUF3829 domain-containing protein [Polyangiaceae bacterium]